MLTPCVHLAWSLREREYNQTGLKGREENEAAQIKGLPETRGQTGVGPRRPRLLYQLSLSPLCDPKSHSCLSSQSVFEKAVLLWSPVVLVRTRNGWGNSQVAVSSQ